MDCEGQDTCYILNIPIKCSIKISNLDNGKADESQRRKAIGTKVYGPYTMSASYRRMMGLPLK